MNNWWWKHTRRRLHLERVKVSLRFYIVVEKLMIVLRTCFRWRKEFLVQSLIESILGDDAMRIKQGSISHEIVVVVQLHLRDDEHHRMCVCVSDESSGPPYTTTQRNKNNTYTSLVRDERERERKRPKKRLWKVTAENNVLNTVETHEKKIVEQYITRRNGNVTTARLLGGTPCSRLKYNRERVSYAMNAWHLRAHQRGGKRERFGHLRVYRFFLENSWLHLSIILTSLERMNEPA